MPERPKRRKNNKNKRKNKNNRGDTSTHDNGANNGEISSNENVDKGDSIDVSKNNLVLDETKTVQEEIIESTDKIANISQINTDNLNEDLNNNSNQNSNSIVTDLAAENVLNMDTTDSVAYFVETPEQPLGTNKTKLKNIKSKSLDNEDVTKIVEITDDVNENENCNALALVDSQNVLVTHVESDIEWEIADELNSEPQLQEHATGTFSITKLPLAMVCCEQNKSLTPEEEKSLRSYLKTINLVTQPEKANSVEIKTEIEEIINQEIKQKLRKRGIAVDFFLHRLGPSRILDVIDEEGSSESSMTSRRQSYLSDKKSDIEDLEDDVFEDKNKNIKQKMVTSISSSHKKTIGKLIPQECVLVGAKMKDQDIEARGDWTMRTVEKMSGAEVVYLTDTSSSSSSLHEMCDDDDSIDTDVSVRMITPTIEVTDTESLLKKTFIQPPPVNKGNDSNESSHKDINKISESLDETNIQSSKKKREFIVKINREDDVKDDIKLSDRNYSLTKLDSEKSHLESSNIVCYENKKLKVEKSHNHELLKNVASTDSEDQKERIINIDIEKDSEQNECTAKNVGSQNTHEIVVLSTDNIETNLYVKDIDTIIDSVVTQTKSEGKLIDKDKFEDNKNVYKDEKILETELNCKKNSPEAVSKLVNCVENDLNLKNIDKMLINQTKSNASVTQNSDLKSNENKYMLETKLIKCEFNDAINNLINEVAVDSEDTCENLKDSFSRQDSSSSVDSSQCTAKYNPNFESLNDISSIAQEEIGMKSNVQPSSNTTSHIKDLFERITEPTIRINDNIDRNSTKQPLGLKDLCVQKIAALPYGDKILEELACVSKRLQDFTTLGNKWREVKPNKDQINSTTYSCKSEDSITNSVSRKATLKDHAPPPVQPRHSSLRKSQDDDHKTGKSPKSESTYICLSPSQKMLMEKTNTVINKEDSVNLINVQKETVGSKEYKECYKNKKTENESCSSNSPNMSFKSQTGSRLLALIRDPILTRNIESLNDRLCDNQGKRTPITNSETYQNDRNARRDFLFKPIPPPRPKKYSSSFYESDESSDFTDTSMRSVKRDKKIFHYSTGTLNEEIENDVSSIQNMHRFITDVRDGLSDNRCPRRPSLPKDICEQQMEYIRKKEKEVEAEIQRLEALKNNIPLISNKRGPRAPLISETEVINDQRKDATNYVISRQRETAVGSQEKDNKKGKMSSLFNSSQEELLREKMYTEYVTQMAEREERKHHKVIKITNTLGSVNKISKSMSALDNFDTKVNNRIEKEFISRARERWDKLGIKDPETEDERDYTKNIYKEPKVIEHKIKVIEGGEEKDVKKLPSHLQEFVRFTARDKEESAGNSGESTSGPATPHLVIMCAVIIIVIAVGKYILRLLRYK